MRLSSCSKPSRHMQAQRFEVSDPRMKSSKRGMGDRQIGRKTTVSGAIDRHLRPAACLSRLIHPERGPSRETCQAHALSEHRGWKLVVDPVSSRAALSPLLFLVAVDECASFRIATLPQQTSPQPRSRKRQNVAIAYIIRRKVGGSQCRFSISEAGRVCLRQSGVDRGADRASSLTPALEMIVGRLKRLERGGNSPPLEEQTPQVQRGQRRVRDVMPPVERGPGDAQDTFRGNVPAQLCQAPALADESPSAHIGG